MIPVTFIWYIDPGAIERTWYTLIPQVPTPGQIVCLGDDFPKRDVIRVYWVFGDTGSGWGWAAEVYLR